MSIEIAFIGIVLNAALLDFIYYDEYCPAKILILLLPLEVLDISLVSRPYKLNVFAYINVHRNRVHWYCLKYRDLKIYFMIISWNCLRFTLFDIRISKFRRFFR